MYHLHSLLAAAQDYKPFTPGAEDTGQVSAPLFVVLAYSLIWVVLLLFVASVDVLVYPAWVACLEVDPGPWYAVFYGAQPLVLLAFFAEHRRWRAAANAALGEERF